MRAPRAFLGASLASALLLSMAALPSPVAAADHPAPAEIAQQVSATQASARVTKHISFVRWNSRTVRRGTFAGTRLSDGIVIGRGTTQIGYRDPYGHSGRLDYDRGRWFSPWARPGFQLTELIASYRAATPRGTFIEVSVQGRTRVGRISSWDSLGRWASHDRRFHRMSLGDQGDDLSRVAVDTLVTHDGVTYKSWRLRVSLLRRAGSAKSPRVTMIGAVVSRLPATSTTSRSRGQGRVSLAVPRYSQEIHVGEYPQWDGGGEAWCSPTSTSMVLGFWGTGPTPRQYAWVNDAYRQPWVDYAARYTYAWGYDGTGDWPFNTAYAARFDLDAFVTRLRSLREAELFVRAGIPLVASIAFDSGELDGSPLNSTAGHLLVIRGFTARGAVIVNDPAADRATEVRRVYQRGQFERAWLDSTRGTVYVIHNRSTPLPQPRLHTNW